MSGFADCFASLLLKFYKAVVVPPEAPEKSDHGDIDVLVDEPLFRFTGQDLAKELGAEARMKAGATNCFALRISGDSDNFFQLDVHQCKKGCFEWESVIYSYGDIWRIIGSTVTRFGLAINDSGLHARIEEVEATHRKDSLLLLTGNPHEMMEFLGLDVARYKRGFATLDEIFGWATSMPLFPKKLFEKENVSEKERRAREKRPMYWQFVTEWLPQKTFLHATTTSAEILENCDGVTEVQMTAGSSNGPTAPAIDERKDLLNKALLKFDKREEYEEMLRGYRNRTLKDAMWKQIARTLPIQGKELGQAIVALKTLVWWNDGQPRLKLEAEMSTERIPALDADTVERVLLPWIKEHWSQAVVLYEGSAR